MLADKVATKDLVKVLAAKHNRVAKNAASVVRAKIAAATTARAAAVTVQAMHWGAATTAIAANQSFSVIKRHAKRAFFISLDCFLVGANLFARTHRIVCE